MFVITGGGSGIGRALALELANRGESVCIVGRRTQALEKTAAGSPLISCCSADVSSHQGRLKLLATLQSTPHLKGLIHNAGVLEPIIPLSQVKEADWQTTMATNLNAPLFLTKLLLNKLKKARVLHIGSAAAHFPVASWSAYCVSKAGLAMLTRCWQLELGYEETAFASVMPGIIDTDMQALIRASSAMEEEKHHFFEQLFAEKRLISPETVAQFLSWLLLTLSPMEFSSQEWDIYETDHHHAWLRPPYEVPALE